jgi:hypothetical protein
MQLQRGLGLLQQCLGTGHGTDTGLLTRRELLDKAGLLTLKAKNTRWSKLFLKSSNKQDRLERQLELDGLDAMQRLSIASNILKG